MTDSNRKKALAALLGAVLIWSSTYVTTKQALSQVPPMTLAFMRFALASVVLFPFFYRGPDRRERLPWGTLALLGLTGAFMFFALQNWGLSYTSVSAGSLIHGGAPVLIALLSAVFLREKINALRALGIFLAIAGVAGIVLLGGDIQGGSRPTLGNLLMLGSALSWAVYTVLNKKFSLTISPVTATLATFIYGMVFLLPFAAVEMHGFSLNLSWLTAANVLYLGVVASAIPIFLWNYGLKYYDASQAGLFINLVPVVSVLSAVAFMGERVIGGQLLAGVVVILGVVLAGVEPPDTN